MEALYRCMQTNATEIMAHVVRSNPGIRNMVIKMYVHATIFQLEIWQLFISQVRAFMYASIGSAKQATFYVGIES